MKVKKTLQSKFEHILHTSNSFTKVLIIAIYIFLIFLCIYHVTFANKIIPGVKIGSVYVGGKTYEQAKQALEDYEKTQDKELKLRYVGKDFTLDLKDLQLTYNWESSIIRAFEVGRTGNILVDNKDKLAGLVKNLFIGAFYDYQDEILSTKLSEIKGEINKEAVKASVKIDQEKENTLTVTQSSDGLKVMDEELFNVVIGSFDRVDFSKKDLPVKTLAAGVKEDDIVDLLPQLNNIVFNKITIKRNPQESKDTRTWVLEQKQLMEFLDFQYDDQGKVQVELNKPRFEAYIENLSLQINELPRGRVEKFEGNIVVDFKITKDGSDLDIKKFTEDFKKAYFNSGTEVVLAMKNSTGPDAKEKYGIYTLLGEGKSKFTGSANARIRNLSLAAERTNGVLVPPQVIYSFNNAVGEISARNGYDTAYIIQAGRTVLGEGGGVCQTSTTLFRSVLNAGLPVVTRYPHAYRVVYYELDSPVGFDASIYQPTLDFQFKNDTPNYILIQSEVDLKTSSLVFRIYGTSDGRSVEISKPLITNQSPPPEALYQDDPNLPKGVTKQVDFAAWGANVSFTRTVKKAEAVLFEDKFNSRFQPWRAVYLVGTKD